MLATRLPISLFFLLVLAAATVGAEPPGGQPDGRLLDDKRLGPLVNLDGYFPFTPYKSKEAWQERAQRLHRQLLVATGLWPMPTKTAPEAVVHGKVVRDGYTVEKVYLQSYPGHFVTGNLYRPQGRTGRLPAVLSPHGHWPDGRFNDSGPEKVREAIAEGAERFEIGGRYPLQARCVQLARMGCIVFHYDMVSYADSSQFPYRLLHLAVVRPQMNTAENWGYFSPQAELRLQSAMGLQTYNSIRALDWLSSLPDVDPHRIAVTGSSGGATQSFILAAIDPRPAVAFPAVMVSTGMQGGCPCENASYLRVGTGNIEIAAMIAPRPLGMTAADDWTRELASKGLPELKQHYRMFGAEELVMAKPLLQFKHNYNYVSREVMYHWLNRQLKLGLPVPVLEEDFKPLSIAEMSVCDDAYPRPPGGEAYERSLLKWITTDSERQMAELVPHDKTSLAKYRAVVGGAVDIFIGRSVPPPGTVKARPRQADVEGALWLRNETAGEEVRAQLLVPKPWNKQIVIWVGKEGGLDAVQPADTNPTSAEALLLKAGAGLLAIDLFGQGVGAGQDKSITKNRLNSGDEWKQWTSYAGFTYGYNYPLFAQRVHDILTAVSYARHGLGAEKVFVAGLRGAGPWVAAARAQAGAAIDRAVVDTGGFRFARLNAIDDADFLPGGAKYLDLPGMLALSAPYPLGVMGEGQKAPPVLTAAYQAAGDPQHLALFSGNKNDAEAEAVRWLLQATVGQ